MKRRNNFSLARRLMWLMAQRHSATALGEHLWH